jgi:hypothetical protein
MWRIWWAPNNANKWQMRFNSAFKGLMYSMCHEDTEPTAAQLQSFVPQMGQEHKIFGFDNGEDSYCS